MFASKNYRKADAQVFDAQGRDIVVQTTSGDVEIQGQEGQRVSALVEGAPMDIQEEDGRLFIVSPKGSSADLAIAVPHHCTLSVRAVSGDAIIKQISGKVSAESTSGDIVAQDLSGDIGIRTLSGDIALRCAEAQKVRLRTTSGECTVEAHLNPESRVALRSVSGDLKLCVPPDQGLTVRGNLLSGDFSCSLPHKVERQNRRSFRSEINGGGPEVKVRSISGDVVISSSLRADDEPGLEEDAKATSPFKNAQAPEVDPFDLDDDLEFDAQPASESCAQEQRMEILRAIETGEMEVSEGLQRLRELD